MSIYEFIFKRKNVIKYGIASVIPKPEIRYTIYSSTNRLQPKDEILYVKECPDFDLRVGQLYIVKSLSHGGDSSYIGKICRVERIDLDNFIGYFFHARNTYNMNKRDVRPLSIITDLKLNPSSITELFNYLTAKQKNKLIEAFIDSEIDSIPIWDYGYINIKYIKKLYEVEKNPILKDIYEELQPFINEDEIDGIQIKLEQDPQTNSTSFTIRKNHYKITCSTSRIMIKDLKNKSYLKNLKKEIVSFVNKNYQPDRHFSSGMTNFIRDLIAEYEYGINPNTTSFWNSESATFLNMPYSPDIVNRGFRTGDDEPNITQSPDSDEQQTEDTDSRAPQLSSDERQQGLEEIYRNFRTYTRRRD